MEDFEFKSPNTQPEDAPLRALALALLKLRALQEQVPTLASAAQVLLSSRLKEKVQGLDVRDIHVYTVGQAQDKGISLLDILIQALENGREPTFDLGAQGLYASPDPVRPGPALKGLSLLDVEKVAFPLAQQLKQAYPASLHDFWQPQAGPQASSQAPRRQLEKALAALYFQEIECMLATGALAAPVGAWLAELPSEAGSGALMHIASGNGPVPGFYAIGEVSGNGQHGLWLWSACHGFNRCASVQAMTMLLAQQQDVAVAEPLQFSVVDHALFTHCAAAVIQAQRLATAAVMAKPAGSLKSSDVRAIGKMEPLLDNCEARVASLLKARRLKDLPGWMSRASEAQRQDYQQREQHLAHTQASLDALLADYRDHQAFARLETREYVSNQLGMNIDPDDVMVTVRFNLMLGGQALDPETQLRLSDFALETLDPKLLNPSVVQRYAQAGMSPEFLSTMIQSLNLRVRFPQVLEDVYMSQPVQALMVEVLRQRMGLSLRRARYQDALGAQHFNAIDGALQQRFDGQSLPFKMGCIIANGSTLPCRDLLVFKFEDGYVVYAPGCPSGQDFLTARTKPLLDRKLAGLATSAAGRSYLTNQLDVSERSAFAHYLDSVEKLPTDWLFRTSVVELWTVDAMDEGLSQAAFQKVNAHLDDYSAASPEWYRQANSKTRQALGKLERCLESSRRHFKAISALETFDQFARKTIQSALDTELSRLGITQNINVDSLILEPEPDARMTLIRAVCQQIDIAPVDVVNMKLISTLNQPLPEKTRLAVAAVIRKLHVADDYIKRVTEGFDNWKDKDYDRRLKLNFNIVFYEMSRAILIHQLQGHLTAAQAQWLQECVERLLDPKAPSAEQQPMDVSGIYRLGLGGLCVQGVYLFRHRDSHGTLEDFIYTPHAPDGIWLRSRQDFHTFLEDRDLATYVYRKVRFRDQAKTDKLLKDWIHPAEPFAKRDAALGPHSPVGSIMYEFQQFVQGIIEDVDDSTVTRAERFTQMLEGLFATALSLAVLPFPPAAMALNVFMTARTLVKGIHAYQDGDNAAAFWHLFDVAASLADFTGATDALKGGMVKQLLKGPVDKWFLKGLDKMQEQFASALVDFLKSQTEEGEAAVAGLPASEAMVW